MFWVVLRRLWPDWTRPLVIVKPETVIASHRQGFKVFWRHRSRSSKIGRPRIPRKHIAFIQRISGDHPEWGEDKIAEEVEEITALLALVQSPQLRAEQLVELVGLDLAGSSEPPRVNGQCSSTPYTEKYSRELISTFNRIGIGGCPSELIR